MHNVHSSSSWPLHLQYGYILPEKEELHFKVYFRRDPSMILRYPPLPIIFTHVQLTWKDQVRALSIVYTLHVLHVLVYISKEEYTGSD